MSRYAAYSFSGLVLAMMAFPLQADKGLVPQEQIQAKVSDAISVIVDPTGQSAAKAPGAAVGIVTQAGSSILGFGTVRIGENHQPDGDTYFGIGSITKIFGGIILAKAVLDGDMNLNDRAARHLKNDIHLEDSITLADLVAHSSGLPNFPTNIKSYRDMDGDGKNDSIPTMPARNYTREMLIECIDSACKRVFKPGERVEYSNLGIGLLGVVMSDYYGFEEFDSLNRAHLTQPLGMKDTGTNTPAFHAKAQANSAQGYFEQDGKLHPVPFSDMGVLASGGEIITTANDLNRLLEGLTGIKQTPLSDAFREAIRPLRTLGNGKIKMAYAIGVRPSKHGGSIYVKGGSVAGYSAFIVWRTDPKVGLIFLVSRGSLSAQLSQIGQRIMEQIVK